MTRLSLSSIHNESAHAWSRGRTLPIKHHDRKSLGCHWLMSCLPIICVGVYVCAQICPSWQHTCQSAIPSGSVHQWRWWGGVSKERQGEAGREGQNRKNGWSESQMFAVILSFCGSGFPRDELSRRTAVSPVISLLTVLYLFTCKWVKLLVIAAAFAIFSPLLYKVFHCEVWMRV